MNQKEFYTIKEVADLLGISRIAVYKKVKLGKINAQKIGRNFAIRNNEIQCLMGKNISNSDKKILLAGIKKTIKEYGYTLKKLEND